MQSIRGLTVKLNLSVTAILVVIALTIVAASYRVITAQERVRMRMKEAQASCTNAGGLWVKVDNQEACQPAAESKKI